MEFPWKSEEEKLAIIGSDEDIYPRLGLRNRAALVPVNPEERCCGKELYIDLDRTYNAMDGTCNRRDLEDFVGEGLKDFTGSGWSVFWHAKNRRRGYPDEAYEDGFRGVVTFGIIEFSIRPVDDTDRNGCIPGREISRLIIGRDDIRYIFNQILIRYPATQEFSLSKLGGRWHAIHPRHRYTRNALPEIPFDWRIARLSQERIVTSVTKWRHDQCTGPGRNYWGLVEMYNNFRMDQGSGTQMPPPVLNPGARKQISTKRKSWMSSTSPEPEMSHKRQSQDFASSLYYGSDLSPILAVTRDMSSLAITSPGSAYGPPVAAYQQPYQQPMQGYGQPGPDRAPRQRAYGDEIPQSELDRSRGIGPIPGSIQYQLQQQARAGLQAMRPPVQGPPVHQSRTQTMPGIDSMLRGAPPPTTFHPPGYPLPPMSSRQYGRPPGYHGAYYRNESTPATPQGRASPQSPYQYYHRGGSTGRGGSPFQGPGPTRGGYQSGGPQAAQEQGRWPGRGGGGGAPPGLNRPREEDQGEYEEDYREEYEEDYEEDYQGEYQEDFRPGFQHGSGRGGGPSRG